MNIEKLDYLRYEAVLNKLYDVTDNLDPFKTLELISQGLIPALMLNGINPRSAEYIRTLCEKYSGEYSKIFHRTLTILNLNFKDLSDRIRCCELWHMAILEGFIGVFCEED